MLFDWDDNDIDDDLKKSEGSIGAKIRRYREARGLTQKEVGLRCGFSYSSSDVRIGQYETNKRAARLKVLRDICEALEINEGALMDGDMFYINNMFITCNCKEYIPFKCSFFDRHNSVAFHSSFKSFKRINFTYNDVCT